MGLSATLAFLSLETFLRVHPSFNVEAAGTEVRMFKGDQGQTLETYEIDDTLGYKPILPSSVYTEQGVIREARRVAPDAPARRILFLGDSVVFRGRLTKAIREAWGEEDYEYFNSGVPGYNTAQEVEYFERYSSSVVADHVVLVFHHNDFQSTPLSFYDREGRLQVIAPSKHRSRVWAGLYRWSFVYRYYIGASRSADETDAQNDIRENLLRLKQLVAAQGAELTVLVLPHLKPLPDWPMVHRERQAWIVKTLGDLRIEHHDLLEPMKEALADGVDIQESKGDHDHPSGEVCTYFARFLWRTGMSLEERRPR